jgi:hypothetical protein
VQHKQIKNQSGNLPVNLEGSTPGIYILRFISGKDIYMVKIVIQ